jgi:arylsulfatase A-like enzyme
VRGREARDRALTAAAIFSVALWVGIPSAAEEPVVYRFDDHLDAALTVDVDPIGATGGGHAFEFEGDESAPWTPAVDSARVTRSDGRLTIVSANYGSALSPDGLTIDPHAIDTISIRMRVVGSDLVALIWKPEQVGRFLRSGRFHIHVPEPGTWYTYNIKTAGLRDWHRVLFGQGAGRNRRISQLRIDVSGDARVEIDFIRMLTPRSFFSSSPAGVSRFQVERRMRTCLYAHSPGAISYGVRVPDAGVFTAEVTVVDATLEVEFSVQITKDGETVTVLRRGVTSAEQWHELRCDLAAWAGSDVVVTLRTECDRPGNVALWGNPVLYGGRRTSDRASPGGHEALGNPPRNVVVYLIDALRADHLDAYGYSRPTAPTITDLARAGVRFSRFFAHDTWTKPSVASLFSGVPQLLHGAASYGDTVPNSLHLLQELLRRQGFATCAVTENSNVGEIMNLARGFSRTDTARVEEYGSGFRAVNTFELAEDFLRTHRDRAFFLYVHTIEPHDPYLAPEPFRHRFVEPGSEATPIDLYDGEIAAADANLSRMVALLRELGLDQETLLIVTADHGEAFREHEDMTTHTGKPYNELIHVPFVARFPAMIPKGTVVDTNAQIIDIAPTVCELLGVEPSPQFQGHSLLPLLIGGRSRALTRRTVFSLGEATVSAIRGDWKLFGRVTKGGVTDARLYHLPTDFGETTDIAAQHRAKVAALVQAANGHILLQRRLANGLWTEAERPISVDQETIDRLKALGYIE